MTITIHPSSLYRWAECESREYFRATKTDQPSERAGGMTAAQVVGNLTHAMMLHDHDGQPADFTCVVGDEMVIWDTVTPNRSAAEHQAQDLARHAQALLAKIQPDKARVEWERQCPPVEVGGPGSGLTLEGRPDGVVQMDDGRVAIVDLKTGETAGAGVWYQMGAYAELTMDPGDPFLLAVVHVPRTSKHRYLHTRQGSDAVETKWWARNLMDRVAELFEGGTHSPVANPGTHCQTCPNTHCPVRAITIQ